METEEEVLNRIKKELESNVDKEIIEYLGVEKTKRLIEIIIENLKGAKWLKNINIEEFKFTANTNKDGERLIFLRASFLKHGYGQMTNFAFDSEGNYLCYVKTSIQNVNPPHEVEIEYYSNPEYKNKGNVTTLAKEVIKEVLEDKIYDNLKVGSRGLISNIDSIIAAINKDNYASLAVAKKLGFDETGHLTIEKYYEQKENSNENQR